MWGEASGSQAISQVGGKTIASTKKKNINQDLGANEHGSKEETRKASWQQEQAKG
jgi:hypothetical protein